jgi:hypothetical protein
LKNAQASTPSLCSKRLHPHSMRQNVESRYMGSEVAKVA